MIFGIDNTFLGRALAADILEPLGIAVPPTIPADLRLDATSRLVPVDVGYVCLNADTAWFARRGLALPVRLEDLTLPAYRGLLVVEDPAASSPGLAFLLATIARFGESGAYPWQRFWQDLRANDVLVARGWSDAYYNEFSATGSGRRPLVVSYATSPAAEMFYAAEPKPTEPPTVAILPERGKFPAGRVRRRPQGDPSARPRTAVRGLPALTAVPGGHTPPDVGASRGLRCTSPRGVHAIRWDPARPAILDPALIDDRRDDWTREWTRIVLK